VGTAKRCSELSQAVCDYVAGCRWTMMFGTYTCAGQAVACDERAITGRCDGVLGKSGCTEAGGCSGTARACGTFAAADCPSTCQVGFE